MFSTSLSRTLLCGFIGLGLMAPLAAAKSFQRLFVFDKTNGAFPGAIVQGTDGNFYGVATTGGTNNNDITCGTGVGCGTIFKVSSTGGLTTIYNFCALTNCADGAAPAALVLGADGNFYGVTGFGGATKICPAGCGSIFRLTPAGQLTTLYSFCTQSACLDGHLPVGLALGIDGNFYGATSLGGTSGVCNGYKCGTIFQITPGGKFTSLYSFCELTNCADGSMPNSVIQANDGNLYGTTQTGGVIGDSGTVFKLTTGGVETALYSFCSQSNCDDGAVPMGGLIQASDGDFYGTTYFGGTEGEGTVFEITSTGQLTTLYNFCTQTGCPSGGNPTSSLIQATDGNLFSTTLAGAGTCAIETDCGTIFGMTTKGQFKTIYTFCHSETSCNDAREPSGLVQGTDGNLYGTTVIGGETTICVPYGCGSFYRVLTGFAPFVAFVNHAGTIGSQAGILGQELSSVSGVFFNGVPAQFKVQSSTYLTATVPAGATTGTVTVTTGDGTLKSNVAFQVLP